MNQIRGTLICITGRLEHGDRNEIFRLITAHGGIRRNSVSSRTDYLVLGDISCHGGCTKKLKRAKELGIKIISEAELFEILRQTKLLTL